MLAVALLSGCSDDDGIKKLVKVLDEPTYTSTITLSRSEQGTNEAINSFSANLIGEVAKNYGNIYQNDAKQNFNISPLSLALSMDLVANSVDDSESESIAKLFKYENLADFNSVCSKLMLYLPYKDNGAEMSFGNSVWLSDEYSIPEKYVSNINQTLYTEVYNSDFSSTETIDKMNSWCAQKTNNKIKEVVDNISGRIILLNALYFQGEWSSKFDKGSTTEGVFHGSEGDQTSDMMRHNYIITSFFYTDDCYGVALPFKNDKVEMIFIMPNNDEEDIFTFSKRFDDTIWSDLLASRTRKELNISLPKFKVEQRGNMTNILNDMGLPGTMTFSKAGIYTSSPIKVQQNTYTYVDEGGAVAAAVTKVEGDTANFGSPDMSKIVFDRPFLYFIRSTETGSIIMAGRVCNL